MSSPTQRSREFFKKLDFASAIVEHFNPHVKVRQDLFGFGDVLVCVPPSFNGRGEIEPGHHLLVQVTSDDNVSKRVKKIVNDCPHARDWLESGGRIVVHGWGKKGAAGKRKLWTLRTVQVTLADLSSVEPPSCSPSGGTGRGRVSGRT